ncbi:MAG: hypothetical protein CVU06_12085, partial [Bacteroidetes bacterium HGW-Bacteroidetes-22]
ASPGRDLSSTTGNGLMANNGLLADIDYNHMIAYGIGVGVNLGLDYFGMNEDIFLERTAPSTYNFTGGYLSGRLGLNLLMNLPVEILRDKFVLNFFGELNGGLRSFTIPDVDLNYDELQNKYTEVTYRSRSNVLGYAGYSAGVQFLFSNCWGINLSYSALMKSQHRIDYSVRAVDVAGVVTEDEDFLSARLDRTGIQIGFLFIIGR